MEIDDFFTHFLGHISLNVSFFHAYYCTYRYTFCLQTLVFGKQLRLVC